MTGGAIHAEVPPTAPAAPAEQPEAPRTAAVGGLYRIYPVLFAIIPVLSLAAHNPGIFPFVDAVAVCVVLAAAIAAALAVVYGVLRVRLRPDAAADIAALVIGAAVLVLFTAYPQFSALLRVGRPYAAAHPVMVAAGVVACAAAGFALWTGRRRRGMRHRPLPLPTLRTVGQFLCLVGTLVTVWSAVTIVYDLLRDRWALRNSAVVRDLARPVPIRPGAATGPRRDVYVLILDEYASAAVLRDRFGFDNRPFEDSLRALGFTVPAQVRSNYTLTGLSVTSFLNFTHLRAFAEGMPGNDEDYTPEAFLLEHNRAVRFLKSRGYRFLFFPSSNYGPTRHNRNADYEYDAYPRPTVGEAVRQSLFTERVAEQTALHHLYRFIVPSTVVRAGHAARTLEAFATLGHRPAGGAPVFAVAHVLMPHIPFVVDSACRPYPRNAPYIEDYPSESPLVRSALAGELACLNREVLAAARELLSRPGPRPIIILQGDHGTQSLRQFDTEGPPTPAQSRERFNAFGAYYLPDGGAATLPDTVSVVNVLRDVFSYYFGADLPPLPNAMYFSRGMRHLTEVDTLTYRPRAAPTR